MRFLEFTTLLEYNRSKTEQALGNAIIKASQRDSYLLSQNLLEPQLIDAVINSAEEADPTANKQYVVWIVKQFTKKGMKFEDMYKLHDDLETFVTTKGQHKRLGINSDINQYDWRSIVDVAKKLSSTELADTGEEVAPSIPDVKVLYNGPLGILSIPKTEAASCELGSGTRWCTAARNRNMFDYYNQQGPLYVWNDKKLKEKFQFHFESFQFMDSQDTPIDADQLNYFAFEHPVTKKLFASKKEGIGKGLGVFISYVEDQRKYEDDPHRWEMEHGNPPDQNEQFDELEAHAMFQLAGKENVDQYIKYIKKIPRLAFAYVQGIVNGSWPEGEKAILEDPWYTIAYARDVLKKRWPEAEPKIARYAATYSYYRTVEYARDLIKKRWPEAEKFGVHNPSFVLEYAEKVIRGRWPEAEAQFGFNMSRYDIYVIKRYLETFKITIDDLNLSDERKNLLKGELQNIKSKRTS